MSSYSSRYGKRLLLIVGSGLSAYAAYRLVDQKKQNYSVHASSQTQTSLQPVVTKGLPARADHLKKLKCGTEFDVLVIGGGATGCGVALDSVTRGLSTALIELDDFSSGTSSRSTKLIHGGVRYLQKAVLNLDYAQYKMVKEALQERANLLDIAPHLSYPLPIMLPVYHWWQIPYYWVGIKCYDLVAGKRNVKSSYYLSKKNALERFPMLKGDEIAGALVYYDGQHNDARMNLAIALTAVRYGATVANHVKVTNLYKNTEGKLCGARMQDQLTGQEWDMKAKTIINATGPFTDSIRLMDDPKTRKICQPSAGVHIVLPGYYSPESMGLIDPSTSDGRVIFFLPWEGFTVVGTTDTPCEVTHNPGPTEKDIQFILREVKNYFNADINVRRGDVMSAWCGIRPLVLDPSKPNTESIARNHIIDVSPSGLITIAGGKWTTYRVMAQEAVDSAINSNPDLKPVNECQTLGLLLEGGKDWTPTQYIRLVQDYGIEPVVAQHLSTTYGEKAFVVAKLAELTGKRWPVAGRRLHPEFPYIEAEVRFACREYACTAIDVIARRMRIAFLNVNAAEEILPHIIEIMAEELSWNKKEQEVQLSKAVEFLKTEMGQQVNKELRDTVPISLTKEEINRYSKQFHSLDRDRKGYIGINDLRRSIKSQGVRMTDEELHLMLSEVDINKNGQIELGEYLELMSAIKTGNVAQSRLAKAIELEWLSKEKISVERSGGGL